MECFGGMSLVSKFGDRALVIEFGDRG